MLSKAELCQRIAVIDLFADQGWLLQSEPLSAEEQKMLQETLDLLGQHRACYEHSITTLETLADVDRKREDLLARLPEGLQSFDVDVEFKKCRRLAWYCQLKSIVFYPFNRVLSKKYSEVSRTYRSAVDSFTSAKRIEAQTKEIERSTLRGTHVLEQKEAQTLDYLVATLPVDEERALKLIDRPELMGFMVISGLQKKYL